MLQIIISMFKFYIDLTRIAESLVLAIQAIYAAFAIVSHSCCANLRAFSHAKVSLEDKKE